MSENKNIIDELISNFRNSAGSNEDPRVKAIIITKLQEASLWFGLLYKKD